MNREADGFVNSTVNTPAVILAQWQLALTHNKTGLNVISGYVKTK